MKKLVKISLMLLIVSLMSCGDDEGSTGPGNDAVVGTWTASVAAVGMQINMTFNADGTYSAAGSGTMMGQTFSFGETGTYTATATSITTTATACTEDGASVTCEDPTTETVTISISGNTMTVTDPDFGDVLFTKS